MSQAHVDFVRSAYDRFNGGEKVPPADVWYADGEYITSSEDPDSEIHSGLEAVRKQFERWVETYRDLRVEPIDILAGKDRAEALAAAGLQE